MSNVIDFQKKKQEADLIKKENEKEQKKEVEKNATLEAFREILNTEIIFD